MASPGDLQSTKHESLYLKNDHVCSGVSLAISKENYNIPNDCTRDIVLPVKKTSIKKKIFSIPLENMVEKPTENPDIEQQDEHIKEKLEKDNGSKLEDIAYTNMIQNTDSFATSLGSDFTIFDTYTGMKEAVEQMKRSTLDSYCIKSVAKHFSKNVTLFDVVKDNRDANNKGEFPSIRYNIFSKTLEIPYTGYPFAILGVSNFGCAQGKDAVFRRNREAIGKPYKRHCARPTKKVGCPVEFSVKKLLVFPEYRLKKDTEWQRSATSSKLKERMKAYMAAKENGEDIEEFGTVVYLSKPFPKTTDHRFHVNTKSNAINKINEKVFYIGASFKSYKNVMAAINLYRSATNVQLYRKMEEAIPSENVNIRYKCVSYVCIKSMEKKKYQGKGKNRRVVK